MKKTVSLFLALVLLCCLPLTLTAQADAAKPTVKWSLGSTVTDDHPSVIAWRSLADALSARTDGRFTLDIYSSSTIGNESEMLDMVRTNTLTMVATNITNLTNYIEDFGVFALPYLFRSGEDFLDYTNNGNLCKTLYGELEAQTGLRMLAVEINGTRCLSTKGIGQINKPDDMKGVKVRSMEAQVWQDVISALGGTPIPVSFSELYMALQTGVVNGQDNPIPLLYSNKFYEVTDFIYLTDHCYNSAAWLINPLAYDALDADDRALFDELVEEYIRGEYRELMEVYEGTAEAAIKKAGVTIVEPDQFDIAAFYANADALVNEKYAVNERYLPYIEEIRATYHYE